MVHPVVIRSAKGPKIFFNLASPVGLRAPNQVEDVQLIQFAYYAMFQLKEGSPKELAAFSKVQPGAPYSGLESDPLTQAIREHQRTRGGTQDAHVSPIPEHSSLRYDGQHSYMLIPLNNNIRKLMPPDFPRIDKHPRCPSALRLAVQRCMSN